MKSLNAKLTAFVSILDSKERNMLVWYLVFSYVPILAIAGLGCWTYLIWASSSGYLPSDLPFMVTYKHLTGLGLFALFLFWLGVQLVFQRLFMGLSTKIMVKAAEKATS